MVALKDALVLKMLDIGCMAELTLWLAALLQPLLEDGDLISVELKALQPLCMGCRPLGDRCFFHKDKHVYQNYLAP